MTLMVGQVLHGFCGGWFGRDSYDDKRIEAVGIDWVVAREEGGAPVFAQSDRRDGRDIHVVLAEHTTAPDPDEDERAEMMAEHVAPLDVCKCGHGRKMHRADSGTCGGSIHCSCREFRSAES